jgi:hypothetical protein
MNRYCRQAVEFQKIYKHYSPNGFIYERFCFLRWFLLRDFMLAHGLKHVLHLDSDVLLYVDVNAEHANWKDFDLSLIQRRVCGKYVRQRNQGSGRPLRDYLGDVRRPGR